MSNWDLFWDILQPLIVLGATVGVVLAVLSGAIRIGWKYAPWVFAGAMLIWYFSA